MATSSVTSDHNSSYWLQTYKAVVLLATILIVVLKLPNHIWSDADSMIVIGLGPLTVWRYGWWITHFIRANIYAWLVFPRLRKRADALWSGGWRPPFIHFLVTTFKERPEITEAMLESIFNECRATRIPGRIFVAYGDVSDERIIEAYCSKVTDLQARVILVRQNQPGKRVAMGLALRAMSRYGVGPDDLAVFMDGDSILCGGIIENCTPLFALNGKLGAVTTDESAFVNGPRWMQAWCDMRFAQRRIAMQSHSLSRKVLTLTGRLSIFRASLVVQEDFVRTIEADHLDHWLWGSFRFLSGDDKSTWFSLLRSGYDMLYVPDASVLTIENIGAHPFERVRQNLMRWSGNMLRNGWRALSLGPGRCGLFTWWCLVDQRISIWTSLSGLVMALVLSAVLGLKVFLGYLIWVLTTRSIISAVLWLYARRIYVSFPFLLYASQLTASMIKIYLLFRISKQRWLNRGDQRSRVSVGPLFRFQNAIAIFLTTFYVGMFVFAICLFIGAVEAKMMYGG